MKKIIVSILALGALSSAAFAAGNRSWDLTDSQYYSTSAASVAAAPAAITDASPFAVAGEGSALTNFERTTMLQNLRNESSSNH